MIGTSTVLIVDDDTDVRQLLKAILSSEGYRLDFAADGAETLEKAAELTPDLILLDVMMPVMDGFEVCRRLRADPQLADVPIVIVSVLDDTDSRLRGLEVGADDFLTKPFDAAELRARVRTITQLNRFRRLRSERTKFEWVVANADDGYAIVNDQDQLLYANAQARSFLGLPPEQDGLPDARFLDVARAQYSIEPHEMWSAWPRRAAPAGQQPRYLVQPETATARARWLQVTVLHVPQEVESHIVRLRDVTAQITTQRAMWAFHAAVIHKLRTPLEMILLSVDLLSRHASDLSAVNADELFEAAFAGIRQLQDDVEDIGQYLEAPRLARGGGRFEVARLPPLVAELSANLGLKPVAVSGHEALGRGVFSLSAIAMELVLSELLENAKKFHPARAPAVAVSVSGQGPDRASLRVSDDGVSLTPEQLALAWVPYYQGEKYFTGEVSGMGLGLPMVASLVWEVGGTCELSNRPDGPGVTVNLTLPFAVG